MSKDEILNEVNDLIDEWLKSSKSFTNKSISLMHNNKTEANKYYSMASIYAHCANQLIEMMDKEI